MPWVLKQKEIDALLVADAQRRYEYFIHRVCDMRAIWGLYDDGWASLSNGDQHLMPLWPHQKYAALMATGDWSAFKPRKIDLRDFLKTWVAGMRERGVQPAIFPVSTGNSILVDLDSLEANLRHELSEWYGEDE